MSDYLVLARKYRSATFDEVVGQEHVATTLVNAINSGRVAHAFLFTGTRGVGKTTMARILAKALNCLSADEPTAKPCNRCDACVAIARGDDVDVIEIDGASNRGIDEIRELRSNAVYRPNRCRYKVYYIDEVHMLTREAFNALLKTLEEPPAHVKFILATTEPEKLPATIVSRCQRFDFRNIPTRLIAEHLEKICKAEKVTVESGAIFRIARAAAGSMRDGLSLLDQLLAAGEGKVREQDVIAVLGTPSDERTASIVTAIVEGDPATALEGLDALVASGVSLASAVGAIGEMFRHMMLAAACGPDSPLIELPEGPKQTVAELSARLSLPALVQAVTVCQTTARNLRGLSCGQALAEAALVRLAAAEKFVDAASLVERLERLSGAGQAQPPTGTARPAGTAGGPRQKKKPVARAGQPAEPQAPEPRAAPQTPRWEEAHLKRGWPEVLSALTRRQAGHISGLLAPARVLSLEGDTLRLGFDPAHESIRRRCAERMGEQITTALGRLFGRTVQCEYVATGEPGQSPRRPAARSPLSTAERAEIMKDPAVKRVLDFFDGSVVDIRPRQPTPSEEANSNEQ